MALSWKIHQAQTSNTSLQHSGLRKRSFASLPRMQFSFARWNVALPHRALTVSIGSRT